MALLIIAILVAAIYFTPHQGIFDKDPIGQPPSDWTSGVTGKGSGLCTVEVDSEKLNSNVLRLSGAGAASWCIQKGISVEDGYVGVSFKTHDEAVPSSVGGIIWRWKDTDNYYGFQIDTARGKGAIFLMMNGQMKNA